jgi:hypothetical protein
LNASAASDGRATWPIAQDRRLVEVGAADCPDRAANAIAPVMAAQRALAPPIRHSKQIDHRIEFVHGLVGDKADPIKRHSAILRLAPSTGVHS